MGPLFIHCVTKVFWTLLQGWTTRWTAVYLVCYWSDLNVTAVPLFIPCVLKCSVVAVVLLLFRVLLKCSVRCYSSEHCLFRVLLKCSECCYSGTIVYSVCSEVFCCYSGTTVHSVCYWSVLNVVTVVNNTVFVWWDSCLFTVLLKCSERVYSGEQHCRLSHGTTVYSLCY